MPTSSTAVPSRSLVTGATGLLGSRVVTTLLDRGSAVTALVRDAERGRRLLPEHPGLTIVTGDITDVDSYRPHLPGIDVVFHTAAYFREYYQPGSDLAQLERTNVTAVEDLLLASAKADIPVVVHTSSVGVLGLGSVKSPADEDTAPGTAQRRNAYFASKVHAEATIARCTATTGQRVPLILPGWMWSVPARLILALVSLAEAPGRLRHRTGGGASAGLRSLVEGGRSRYTSARAQRELGVDFRPLAQTMRDEASWYRDHGMLD